MTKSQGDRRRVVVTGVGAVTPIGLDVREMWSSMKEGRCGVGPIEGFGLKDLYIHIAAEIKGFDPAKHVREQEDPVRRPLLVVRGPRRRRGMGAVRPPDAIR